MPLARTRLLVLLLTGACCRAADPQDLLSRIRSHLREYVTQLPDYTCRVTLERYSRRVGRIGLEFIDRLRLEVAYTEGNELYSWPGDDRFERGIEDLLPSHGLVSNGSYALHMRTLFVRDVAEFAAPRESGGRIQLDYSVSAARSGYSMSTGTSAAPAPLVGSVWLDAATLDLRQLEVRVETRVAASRETTTYARGRIGEVEFVLPDSSELVLIDRDGQQFINRARFGEYHRFAGSSSISYAPAAAAAAEAPAHGASSGVLPSGQQITAALDAAIGAEAAIGDPFTATTTKGEHAVGRVSDMQRAGNNWIVELTLVKVGDQRTHAVIRKTVKLPLAAGLKLVWKTT